MPDLDLCWLEDDAAAFPPTARALGENSIAPGLLAAGGGLDLPRLEAAYRRGIFPWYSEGQPVLWWSPDPRMVLPVAEFKLARSLRKTLARFVRTPGCEVRIDGAFGEVIAACAGIAREGQPGTWIVPEMVGAYRRWHAAGAVHSVETWIDAVHAAGPVPADVGLDHVRQDPGAALAGACAGSERADDAREGGVDADLAAR